MDSKIATVALVVVAAAAFFVGKMTAPAADAPDVDAELTAQERQELEELRQAKLEADAATAAETGGALSSPQARESHLVKQLNAERERANKAEARVAELEASGGTDSASGAATPPKAEYVYDGTEDALAKIDTTAAGEAIAQMTPLIKGMLDSLLEGKPDMALQTKISQLNMTLLSQATALQGTGLSGNGVNGVFTHPAIQVNYIHATLKAADKALTEKQEAQLKAIGDRFVRDEARRVAGYSETTYALQKLVDEADLKDRFYDEVDAMLEPEQVEVLHPEGTRGRIRADLFSSGLIWVAVAGDDIQYTDRESLAAAVGARAMTAFKLPEDQASLVQQLATDYVAGLSNEFLGYKMHELDKIGLLPASRVKESARAQIGLLKAIADRVPMDEAGLKGLRETTYVLIPLKP